VLALHVIAGPDAGARHVLPDTEPQLVGRSTEALGSTDPTVSRRHAELTPSQGRWFLRDLASAHGSFVNGQRAEGRVELRAGDELRFGRTTMRVTDVGGPGDPPPAESDPERLRAIGETVATISHGIRNVLQGLRTGADAVELALRRGDVDMARQGWPIVARNLDRVSWLVMNMLAFSKDRPLEIAETQLEDVVAEAVELMRTTAERRRVGLAFEREEGLPPAPIDANAVHQCVLNLLTNAVEAAPERSGMVRVRCTLVAGAGTFVIEVEDDGPGVPREIRPRLFEPFASSKGLRGTGLGLAVARKLVERHGGRVEHRDRSPRGTVMRIELPADRGDPDAERTRGPVPSAPPDIEWDLPGR
jgi:signal transduction histidine kinase